VPVCLVTGATGAIGPRVVDALGRTFEIRTLSRHAPQSGMFSTPVSAVVGDVADPVAVRTAVRGAAVVIHLASLLHVSNPSRRLQTEYTRVNVGGTSAIVEAAQQEGVSRVVMVSTIAVYGRGQQAWLDEDSPTTPDTPYAQTKLAAEQIALAARDPDGRPLCTVLRCAAVYGPRVKGNYERLVRGITRRRFIPVGAGTNHRTLVYEEDAARALVLAASHPAAAGRIFNVVGGAHTVEEITAAISAALGRRPPSLKIPLGAATVAVRAVESLARVLGRVPRITRSALEKYTEDVSVSGRRIEEELGFAPRVDLQEGWRRTVEGMRQQGRL
jgi:nucleoside-diphosphate-sugar epimerase